MTTYRAVSVDDIYHWYVCKHKHRTIEEATECMFTIGYAGSYILAVEENGRERRLNALEELIFYRAKRRKDGGDERQSK